MARSKAAVVVNAGIMRGRDRLVAGAVLLVLCATATVACATPGSSDATRDPNATVTAPGGGSIDEVVPDATPAPTIEAGADGPVDVGSGLTVAVDSVESVEVTAQTPGEMNGPAVAVTLSVANGGEEALDLSGAIVSLTSADGTFGETTTAAPAAPYRVSVAPGESAQAVYVFMLPADKRNSVIVSVQYAASAPVVVFTR